VAVSKRAHTATVGAGSALTYTLRVTNTGNVSLTAAITDHLPARVTPSGVVTWHAVLPAPGGVWTATVPVTVDWGYAGPLTNVVAVATAEGVGGVYTEEVTATVTPGVAVSKRAHTATVGAGSALTYTLRVTNTGNVSLTATITDRLPAHVTPSGVVTWRAVLPAPGGVWTAMVPVTVDWGYAGPLTNVVAVATAEGVGGVYTEEVTATVTPGVAVSKRAHTATVGAGSALTYTLRVTNTGNVSLTATITDRLPAHVTPSGVVTWRAVLPAPGGVWTAMVPVTVDWGYAGPLTNVVVGGTAEGVGGEAYVTTTVRGMFYLPLVFRQ
jgi:uncharacterized repeat protein (TIGR01451 family)